MRLERAWPALWIFLAVVFAYATAWRGGFQFDDYNVIVAADQVHSWQAWVAGLGSGLRPLLKLSYLLNWSIDPQPLGFHLFNLLVHLTTTGLVYLLARRFGEIHAPSLDWRPVAWVTALWFGLHPAHTEAITYVSGRATSLMTMGYLGALYAYARGRRWCALGGFVAAVLVKESAMLLPFTLLLWEALAGSSLRSIMRRQWPWWLLSALAVLALLMHPGYRVLIGNSLQNRELVAAGLTQLHAAAYLIGQLLWPAALNIDPDLPVITDLAVVWPQWLGLALMVWLAWRWRRERPWISLGVAWAILHLLLFNALLPRTDIANERLLYWGDWALIFAIVTELWMRLPRRWFNAVAVGLAVAMALTTSARNRVYQSEIALWQDTAAKSPHKARVLNNLGYAYAEAGRRAEAERAYRAALRWQPDYLKASNNLRRLQEHQALPDTD
jgi:tetratricopeptide (TPR) repeat protein